MKRIEVVCGVAALLILSGPTVAQHAAPQHSAAQAPSAAVRQALALEQQGKTPEALAAWQAVVKAEPRNAQAYAHKALLEARQEHYPEALADYRKARTLNPAMPELDLNMGLAQFKSGAFGEASRSFEAALRKAAKTPGSPDAARLTVLAGMAEYGAHAYSAAIPYLKSAATADAKNLTLRLALAHCYLWTHHLNEVLDVYREILAINPDSAEADMIAGEALDEKGDKAGAVEQFKAAVAANPKEPNVHFGLAYLLWTQKDNDAAIPEFKAELANDPQNGQAMLYLGDTYIRQNQFDDARGVLQQAEALGPETALVHLDLGIVAMEAGDKDAAARELTRAVALQPENVTAHFRLGTLYRSMGRKEEAKAEFDKASSLNKQTDESLVKRITDAGTRPTPQADGGPTATQPKP